MDLKEMMAAIETIVFVAEEPVALAKLKEIFVDESLDKIQTAVAELVQEFNASRPGLEIREIAGGLRMTTRPEHHEWIRAYLKTRPSAKLSLAALETLAVIAYRQPITLAEIMSVRGIKSTSAIRTLLEKKFITPLGRKKVIGRPILYGTTREFLLHFGLKDLSELPTLEEFEELIGADTGMAEEAAPADPTEAGVGSTESAAAAESESPSDVSADAAPEAAPDPAR